MKARFGQALLEEVDPAEKEGPSKLKGELLIEGQPDHRPLFRVLGFTVDDAATLLINYLDQATDAELWQLLEEARTRTTTNCWCMAYDLSLSLVKFAEQAIEDRGLKS